MIINLVMQMQKKPKEDGYVHCGSGKEIKKWCGCGIHKKRTRNLKKAIHN